MSGLTRIFLSIGQAIGPLLASLLYAETQSSAEDSERMMSFYLACGCINISILIFGNLVATLRPEFVADVTKGRARSKSQASSSDESDVFEKETGRVSRFLPPFWSRFCYPIASRATAFLPRVPPRAPARPPPRFFYVLEIEEHGVYTAMHS